MRPYIPDSLPLVNLDYHRFFALVGQVSAGFCGAYFSFCTPQRFLWRVQTPQALQWNMNGFSDGLAEANVQLV